MVVVPVHHKAYVTPHRWERIQAQLRRKGYLAGWTPKEIYQDLNARGCRGCELPIETAVDFKGVTGSLITEARPEGKPTSGTEA